MWTKIAKGILIINGVALAALALLFFLEVDVSAGSIMDKPALWLGLYCSLVMPITTIAALLVCCRGPFLYRAGLIVVVVGFFAFLAVEATVEGHVLLMPVLDADGKAMHDESGGLIMKVNPHYLDYQRRRKRNSLITVGVMVVGAAMVLGGRRRQKTAA